MSSSSEAGFLALETFGNGKTFLPCQIVDGYGSSFGEKRPCRANSHLSRN